MLLFVWLYDGVKRRKETHFGYVHTPILIDRSSVRLFPVSLLPLHRFLFISNFREFWSKIENISILTDFCLWRRSFNRIHVRTRIYEYVCFSISLFEFQHFSFLSSRYCIELCRIAAPLFLVSFLLIHLYCLQYPIQYRLVAGVNIVHEMMMFYGWIWLSKHLSCPHIHANDTYDGLVFYCRLSSVNQVDVDPQNCVNPVDPYKWRHYLRSVIIKHINSICKTVISWKWNMFVNIWTSIITATNRYYYIACTIGCGFNVFLWMCMCAVFVMLS